MRLKCNYKINLPRLVSLRLKSVYIVHVKILAIDRLRPQLELLISRYFLMDLDQNPVNIKQSLF